jgi:hypothetical protein
MIYIIISRNLKGLTMILDARKMSSSGFRKHSISGALRNFLDTLERDGVGVIEKIVDFTGCEKNPTYIRPFIKQVSKPGERFMTREIGGSLHVWRLS